MLFIRDSKCDKHLECDFEIALVGNPNVGKSSLFNAITGLKQHTGNWSGKTVDSAFGYYEYNKHSIKLVDLPGVYSLKSDSDEEVVANTYLKSKKADCTIIVVDSTNLERNLNLVLQVLKINHNAVLCLNMWDEAKKCGVFIDKDELSLQLGIPVISTSATKNNGIDKLIETAVKVSDGKIKTYKVKGIRELSEDDYCEYVENIYTISTRICNKCLYVPENKNKVNLIDKLLTSKVTGIPIMLLLLGVLFWITIVGANYFSEILSYAFSRIIDILRVFLVNISVNDTIISFLLDGILTTLAWVVAVMLPPMAIFFPIFSLLEDSGVLPRIAFNLDSCFKKVGANGKQSLTMAMGLGCNSCGVMGCRIINSESEKNIAILTNSFVPCNGKLPSLIAITSIFFASTASVFFDSVITSFVLVVLIVISILLTLIVAEVLSKTLYKGDRSVFMMELPPYRKPQIIKTIVYSLKDKALFVLLRAVAVAVPAGALIWLMVNITINDISILKYCTDFLEPFGKVLGLDGVILMAFILGFPANETVIPIMLMSYTSSSTLMDYSGLEQLGMLLVSNGWNFTTAVCFIILCMFHFPCSTTCITIYKETKSLKTTALSVILPTFIGVVLCLLISFVLSL